MFVYFFKSTHFARQDGQDRNLKNKETEHIVKKLTQLKWPKYKKQTKLPKWNEHDNSFQNMYSAFKQP